MMMTSHLGLSKPAYRLFDTHCHLDLSPFSITLESELGLAQKRGVERFLIPSVGPQNWATVERLAQQHVNSFYYALGIHPHFLPSQAPHSLFSLLEAYLAQSGKACIAVGECGLDATISDSAQHQETILKGQLAIAQSARLPVVLHSRKTHNRLLQIIKQSRFTQGGVIHAFSGSEQEAKQFIALGFMLGVGGVITYPRANKTRRAVAALPLEHLVLETDSPDMPLCGFQGQTNTPSQLPLILDELASLKQQAPNDVAHMIWENSHRLFNLPF
ncbi:TatD family hydrolase [Vibrio cincinnatiensis]|uniref:TatD family hydrolase n=1 Tax=Vibrio cincinnatiensis TaxID=675 RepID=UPI001FA95A60|nr:TatD family hydrolase [Vibrio cincinnatiensis]